MIPLVDLHRHLEGSIRPETSIELATRIGTDKLPVQWRSALVAAEREEGLPPYLAKIENATALVRTLDDWRRVTMEAVTDAFDRGRPHRDRRPRRGPGLRDDPGPSPAAAPERTGRGRSGGGRGRVPGRALRPGAARGRAQHQLATLVKAGVRVALCTDNPVVSDTRLTREYELARDLVDAASLDIIRQNAQAARSTSSSAY
jgi:adenosine deaminase